MFTDGVYPGQNVLLLGQRFCSKKLFIYISQVRDCFKKPFIGFSVKPKWPVNVE